MKNNKMVLVINLILILLAIIMVDCAGGGKGKFTVGGTVSGLSGTIILQNNGGDDLTISADGTFTFTTALDNGSSYSVTVLSQPTGQCGYVTNESGTISGANVTNVEVSCFDSGTLDVSFGNNGIVVYNNAAGGDGVDVANSITTDSNGNILVTGSSDNPGNLDMVIWRYNTNGTLDTTFNTPDGIVIHHNAASGNGPELGSSITINPSGDILVTGMSESSTNWEMVIWRYTEDGTLDTTFGGDVNPADGVPDGFVVHNSAAGGNGHDIGYSITTDISGNVLVTGDSWNGNNADTVIWRYNTDGFLDTTFGAPNGFVVFTDTPNADDKGFSITTDKDGKILVTGLNLGLSGNSDMAIWRYNTDGTLDTTFNAPDGFVLHNNAAGGNGVDFGNSITTDSSGRILVAGSSWNGTDADMVIWRYSTDGSLDTTFGAPDGFVVHDNAAGGSGYDSGKSITTDFNGNILVTGSSDNLSGDEDMVIWRYRDDGVLDATFDNDGVVIHQSAAGGDGLDSGAGITIDSSGKILVAGYSDNGSNTDMIIWCYIP
jgi:uncharacterized delta-60 repeat protein